METLTDNELKRAKDIITQGLAKAAQSLSFFMKENIELKEPAFNISNQVDVTLKNPADENLFVLSTELKGELKGVCYLVFNEAEKDEVCKVALPSDIVNNADKLKMMQEPLLLEIDNIIAASVITQLANNLKIKVYGDVPVLKVINSEQIKNIIEEQMLPNKLFMGFQTEFSSSKAHFSPEFFWVLEPEFLLNVKKMEQVQL